MRKYPVSLRFLGSSLAAVTLLVATGASAAERPLSGQAYRIADEAYKAFAQGEYDVAAAKAREAIRLRPDVARLRDLLQKAELARRTMQAQLAFNASAASYQALERRDFAQAVELARKAVDYLPAVPAFRIALINALVAAGELEQAEQAASDMIKPDTSSSEALLLRGAIRQQRGAVESAQTDFDQALSSAGPAGGCRRRVGQWRSTAGAASARTSAGQGGQGSGSAACAGDNHAWPVRHKPRRPGVQLPACQLHVRT
jgi:tetratricopeptide (TPR) repeat protein